jgi:hypothetical protein
MALTSSRAHHGVGCHASRGHSRILGPLAGLAEVGVLFGLDSRVEVDSGVGGLRLGNIAAASGGSGRQRAGKGRGGVSPRGNAQGLPGDRGDDVGHCCGWRAICLRQERRKLSFDVHSDHGCPLSQAEAEAQASGG